MAAPARTTNRARRGATPSAKASAAVVGMSSAGRYTVARSRAQRGPKRCSARWRLREPGARGSQPPWPRASANRAVSTVPKTIRNSWSRPGSVGRAKPEASASKNHTAGHHLHGLLAAGGHNATGAVNPVVPAARREVLEDRLELGRTEDEGAGR